MRALRQLLMALVLALPAASASADEGCGGGHHWECPLYLGEMRLQVAVMMAVVVLAAAGGWLAKRVKRGERQ